MGKSTNASRSVALAAALLVAPCLALAGCGGGSPDGPPGDLGAKKTPSQVLEEAKAQGNAPKP